MIWESGDDQGKMSIFGNNADHIQWRQPLKTPLIDDTWSQSVEVEARVLSKGIQCSRYNREWHCSDMLAKHLQALSSFFFLLPTRCQRVTFSGAAQQSASTSVPLHIFRATCKLLLSGTQTPRNITFLSRWTRKNKVVLPFSTNMASSCGPWNRRVSHLHPLCLALSAIEWFLSRHIFALRHPLRDSYKYGSKWVKFLQPHSIPLSLLKSTDPQSLLSIVIPSGNSTSPRNMTRL